MKTAAVLSFLLCVSALAAEKSRPFDEMKGDCSNYKTDLKKELAAWEQKPIEVKTKSADLLPWSKKLELALAPQADVTFVAAPEKKLPVKGGAHGGIFALESPRTGKVRVAAGSKLWFDVVDRETKKPVEAVEFEMQTGCDKILKTVTFELVANKPYVLQVSGSADPRASFVITTP